MNLQMFLETVTDYQIEVEEFHVEFRDLTVKDFVDFRAEYARLHAELDAVTAERDALKKALK